MCIHSVTGRKGSTTNITQEQEHGKPHSPPRVSSPTMRDTQHRRGGWGSDAEWLDTVGRNEWQGRMRASVFRVYHSGSSQMLFKANFTLLSHFENHYSIQRHLLVSIFWIRNVLSAHLQRVLSVTLPMWKSYSLVRIRITCKERNSAIEIFCKAIKVSQSPR